MINSFTGKYRFLSNFWPAVVELDGDIYPSIEHAYQAAKTHKENRQPFFLGTAGEAKRLGRKVKIRPEWEHVKIDVMRKLIQQKFSKYSPLAMDLLSTGDAELVEGNSWNDVFWGVCGGMGHNHLGRLLMEQRSLLRA